MLSTATRKAIQADLRKRITKEKSRRLFHALYPDKDEVWSASANKHFNPGSTVYARVLYPKHLEFFRAGATYRERCFMEANKVSKTLGGGGYETACHLTGLYPHWWEGRRFTGPVRAWAAGKTNETTRDIIQATLLGEIAYDGRGKVVDGRGVVPGWLLGKPHWKQGMADLVDTIRVRHASGDQSVLGFKSYEQGRASFEGTGQHVIWDDEEPPEDVYGEQLMRVATTRGILMLTFTPLLGMSQVVLNFMPAKDRPVV